MQWLFQIAFSIARVKLIGEVVGENLAKTSPSRPTKNLVKFHLILSLPKMPLAFDFSSA